MFDNLTGIWVNDFSSAVFRGLAFGIASFLVVLGRMTLGSIVTVINYSNRFLEIAHTFMTSNYNFKEELGEYDQLFSILTMPTPEPSSKPFQFEKEIPLCRHHLRLQSGAGKHSALAQSFHPAARVVGYRRGQRRGQNNHL